MTSLKTVKTANKPVVDSKGYCVGEISDLILTDARTEKIDGKKVKFGSQWEFSITSKGTSKSITFRFWTGTTLSPDLIENRLNKLTTILTRLELIKISEIVDDFEFDLEKLIGMNVKFKLEKIDGKKLEKIDLNTILPV